MPVFKTPCPASQEILDFKIHSPALAKVIRPTYSVEEIRELASFLMEKGALHFPSLPNGLFPASDAATLGYHYVWVRDNIQISYAHFVNAHIREAGLNLRTLTDYFVKHRDRFTAIIEGRTDPSNPMNRPHIRFDGLTLNEVPQKWAHAQNDALGYFLWLLSQMTLAGVYSPDEKSAQVIGNLIPYFRAIRFWEDEDSGHWEEARKIESSSIGVVTAALIALKSALSGNAPFRSLTDVKIEWLEDLIERGSNALRAILPDECAQRDGNKYRDCDGAQLFLIYPTAVVDGALADRIINRIITQLRGDVGIRRYRGDSYWCADYKDLLGGGERTRDFSDEMDRRDALLRPGEEAQWCIFDPILSALYGKRCVEFGGKENLELQLLYLNRSLAQITPELRCPEAYYLEHGAYVPNDNTPLLWTQANLWVALHHAQQSVKWMGK
jgi:GH15 family glucan-1,4-alpha-glucosidase